MTLRLPSRRYVCVMTFRARRTVARLGGIDGVRADELVALLLLTVIQLEVWLGAHVQHRVPAALAGAALVVVVAGRRRWPLAAVMVTVAALTAQDLAGARLTQQSFGVLVALVMVCYGAGAFLAARRAWLALGIVLVGGCVDVLIETGAFSDLFFVLIILLPLPWVVGRMVRADRARERANREIAERFDAEREQRALAAAFGERSRIARELHDVIAHSVSVMVIQAGGARIVMDTEPERADASLRSVERAGREALAEMRRLLGLQDGEKEASALAPQPGLADIENLLLHTRAAGLATDLRVEGEPATVSPGLDLCAYRIIQEALTNSIKHAGPARAEVHISWGHDALELEIVDDGRTPNAGNGASGGHGIAGMRERAAAHGGNIQAGAGVEGGFAVRARLPLTLEGGR